MLTAYFDDSGTHAGSDVILMGGLIAHEDEWKVLEAEWKTALGEFGLRRMHMSHCESRKGEFAAFERPRPRQDHRSFPKHHRGAKRDDAVFGRHAGGMG